MLRIHPLLLGAILLGACGNVDDPCESVPEPTCDAGFEPIEKEYDCVNGDGTISGVTEWICVAEDIGTPCDTSGPVDVCGSDLLCVTEPGEPDALVGTCLPTCIDAGGDCSIFGAGWECVPTSNGPDVCAVDYAR